MWPYRLLAAILYFNVFSVYDFKEQLNFSAFVLVFEQIDVAGLSLHGRGSREV